MTYLAVPIAAQNLEQAQQQTKAALAAGAEMLELRTDYLENLSVDLARDLIAAVKTIAGRRLPVIVTCRDNRQGGAIDYPQQLRIDVLTAALKAGAEFIDFEYENFLSAETQEQIRVALSGSLRGRLILSAHNFQTGFAGISKLYRSILSVCQVAIPKIVYTANHINDCFEAFDLLHQTSGERITFCMGEAGIISRIIAKKLNSFVTFASIDDQTTTALGQLPIRQLKELYRYDSIDAATELYGVIADPVGHSLSPAIHNAFFAEKGMNKLYLPLLVKGGRSEFDLFMRNVLSRKWLNFGGFSVTIPHKENALNFVQGRGWRVEPLTKKIGAANTLVVSKDDMLKAYNTDYSAALDSITSGLGITRAGLKELPVVIIGAGGVARAIVAGLSDAGAKIKIYNRTVEKAQKLAAEFGCEFAPLDDLPNLGAKLVINCTSIGMKKTEDGKQETEDRRQKTEDQRPKTSHETPLPEEYLKKDMVVFDTVYNPAQTLLLKQAKKKRAKTIDGLSMFINQAAAQFKLFTGQDANHDLMRKVVVGYLSKNTNG
jgi:3-dehydroquinate dehydratase/shikimate dehydrogenase